MNVTLKPGVDWVGYVDWKVRDFHGYRTARGSSYNAYLVRDEQTALIDTVKAPYAEDLLDRVRAKVPLDQVRFIVCNHAEPDHSSALPAVMAACPNAELVCDEKCGEALAQHYGGQGWPTRIVADGDSLSIGRRSLVFLETPMVHWPESMFTYVPEEKLLFSMDAFGQHLASANRFDDEEDLDVVMAEAKTYYANIVMLYGRPIARVLERTGDMNIEMLAPSHGVVWRSHLGRILEAYARWVEHKPEPKVIILYDTMWGSTERMARAMMQGVLEYDVKAKLLHATAAHRTDVATECLDAAVLAVGSATLNKTLLPDLAGTLTYLKGLGPGGKAGFAFGSYGWARGGARDVEAYLKSMKVELLREPLQVRFAPTRDDLDACRAAGRMLAEKALAMAGEASTAGPAGGS